MVEKKNNKIKNGAKNGHILLKAAENFILPLPDFAYF